MFVGAAAGAAGPAAAGKNKGEGGPEGAESKGEAVPSPDDAEGKGKETTAEPQKKIRGNSPVRIFG